MKKIIVLCLLAMPLLASSPQGTAPAGFKIWTPDSLAQTGKELAAKAAKDPHHNASEQIGDFPNDAFLYAHREADGQAELHETQADVFFVESGTATLIVGGSMVNGETVLPHEIRAASIQGGIRQKLSKGDIVRIPAKTAHQLLLEGSHDFTYFVVKVKGY